MKLRKTVPVFGDGLFVCRQGKFRIYDVNWCNRYRNIVLEIATALLGLAMTEVDGGWSLCAVGAMVSRIVPQDDRKGRRWAFGRFHRGDTSPEVSAYIPVYFPDT